MRVCTGACLASVFGLYFLYINLVIGSVLGQEDQWTWWLNRSPPHCRAVKGSEASSSHPVSENTVSSPWLKLPFPLRPLEDPMQRGISRLTPLSPVRAGRQEDCRTAGQAQPPSRTSFFTCWYPSGNSLAGKGATVFIVHLALCFMSVIGGSFTTRCSLCRDWHMHSGVSDPFPNYTMWTVKQWLENDCSHHSGHWRCS